MPSFFGPDGRGSGSFDEFLARYLQGQRAAQAGGPPDITRLLSRRTRGVLAEAARFALEHGHADLDALHVLRVMAAQSPALEILRAIGVDPDRVTAAVDQRLPSDSPGEPSPGEPSPGKPSSPPALTPSAQRALLHAHQVARAFGSTYIDAEHLFFALVVNQDTAVGHLLASLGVTPQALQAHAADPDSARASAEPSAADAPMLERYGIDLTERAREGALDPVIGRADEIEQAIEVLARRTKNNPVLVGEAGVGKTAVVEGLAQAIAAGDVPEQLRRKRVIALDLPGMLAGTRFRGDFEERLTKLMDEISARSSEVIVFIDEMHSIVGAGAGGEGGMDAGNILKPRLARGELHLIGATTLDEYRKVEKDPALERRFQPVRVDEPPLNDTVDILMGLRGRYEEHHGVRFTDEAIRAAVELSARYVSDRRLPDKAIDLIDQAGARRQLAAVPRVDTAALRAELAELRKAKGVAVAEERYEEASGIRDRIDDIDARLARAETGVGGSDAGDRVVDEAQIAAVISRATGIPVARLTQGDQQRLTSLEADLHERVIGQDDAVTAIAKAVRRGRTGLGDPNRPVGSFLFLGPTGVGKTELAKALAEALFGDEGALIRFDMSEFGERHTVSRLVGAPPGYVGYGEAGQLTERVRRTPYSVILLDEVEKAHPDVFNLLLQVLDDGRLTDGQGRTVDFRNTVVIMTSNLGSEFLASRSGALGFVAVSDDETGFGSEQELRSRVMGSLRDAMRPEFLNRIDEIVLFRKLGTQELRRIVRLLVGKTEARLQEQGIALAVTEEAADWIAAEGYQPEYGARPMRRVIQREVDDRIADLLVTGSLTAGDTVAVSVEDGGLRVAAVDRVPQAA